MDCAKFFSYFLIIVLVLCSLGCLLIGIAGCRKVDIVDGVGPSIGLTVIGAVMLLICILGFVGLRRQSPRLLWVFVGLSITMWVVSVGLHVGTSHSDFEADRKKVVGDIWKKELVEEGSMDRIQNQYNCCGLNSVDDYTSLGRLPPKSCCSLQNCDGPARVKRIGCQRKAFVDSTEMYKKRRVLEMITCSGLFLCIGIATWMAIRFKKQ